jgi:hypothetical protein
VLSGLELLVDVNLALVGHALVRTESQRGYSKVYGACLDELGFWGRFWRRGLYEGMNLVCGLGIAKGWGKEIVLGE